MARYPGAEARDNNARVQSASLPGVLHDMPLSRGSRGLIADLSEPHARIRLRATANTLLGQDGASDLPREVMW